MTRQLVHHFLYRSPDELRLWAYEGKHACLWVSHYGPYTVRTWTNADGRPIATGWFKEGQ